MQHTVTPSGIEHHLFMSDNEFRALRGYLCRAQRNGLIPGDIVAGVISAIGAEEVTA